MISDGRLDSIARGQDVPRDPDLRALARELQHLRRAAPIIADQFSASVTVALSQSSPRTYLYVWERNALEWLREWRKTDSTTPICAWTQAYINYGPPPWGDKK